MGFSDERGRERGREGKRERERRFRKRQTKSADQQHSAKRTSIVSVVPSITLFGDNFTEYNT